MNAPPALSVRALRVAAGAAPVVDGVSLELAPGERVALVGESGCGKTSLALAVLGLLPDGVRVAAGHILLGDADMVAMEEASRRRIRGSRVALIPQDAATALNPVRPVGRQVATVLRRVRGFDRRAAGDRTLALFEEVGLGRPNAIFHRYPHELSGGQCQRVMIAMALGCEPGVILADEPTSALDVTTQAKVMDRLVTMTRSRGTALLLITHDLALAGAWCERALVMYAGRVVESAPTRQLLSSPAHPYSAGLLGAVPRLRGTFRRVEPIPGAAPPPGELPAGCRFQSRCSRATDRCRREAPTLDADGTGRAACFHPLGGQGHD